jgi:iron complex outermembrane recepter protein
MKKQIWKGGIAAAAITVMLATSPAIAQDAPADSNGADQIEDIVVVAQRRSESAQDVPIALTAIGGEALEEAKIDTLSDLTRGVVGIQYDSSSTQRNELFIRGIGTNRFDIGSNPSSGVYIDEIYQPRFADVLTGLLDIERIEILRGPQGTLFGRNTIGGAISVFSADPTSDFSGRMTGTYGNRNLVDVGATVSGPVSDALRVRLTGNYRDRGGFMRDTVSGRDNGIESFSVRGTMLADLSADVSLRLSGSYFESRQSALLGNPESTPFFLVGPFTPQVLDNNPFLGAYTISGGNRIRNGQISGRLTWESDDVTVTALGSWIGFNQRPSQDLDGDRAAILDYEGRSSSDTFSGEIRFASQEGGAATFGDRVRWLAGIYYFSDDGEESSAFRVGRDNILSFLLANPQCFNPATCAPPFGAPTLSYVDTTFGTSHLQSMAVYGQATVEIVGPVSLTFGGRYTHDQRRYTFLGDGSIPGVPLIPVDYFFSRKPTSSAFDPRVALEVRPNDDVLLYASWSRGFKSGATQSTPPNPTVAALNTAPERVTAYEIGMKADFFDRRVRLNVSAFENRFRDLQVRRVIVINGNPTAITENAATSTIRGIEAEATVIPVNGFRIDASYAYLDAKYDRYVVGGGLDFSGNRMPRTPTNRFNVAASYETEFVGGTQLNLRAAYNWTGRFFFQPSNSPVERESSYGLTDVSAQITLPNERTSLQLWGRNIFNTTYRTYLDPLDAERIAAYGDRATYGVTLSHSF